MAENPQAAPPRSRPLSPFLTIYSWPVTMATSITHRVTGVGLAAGSAFLAWWLIAVASGPETFQSFLAVGTTWLGQLVLFGFAWALSYHLLNGVRHLAWDVGYGFDIHVAGVVSWIIIVASVVLAAGVFALAYLGYGGFLA